MPKLSKRTMMVIAFAVVVVGGFFGYRYWQAKKDAIPEGIAYGNGRIEAKLEDVSSKEALRVKEVLVDEGDLVKPGQVLVRLDTVTLDAQLAEAQAQVAAAQEKIAMAQAAIMKAKSEITLAEVEVARAQNLVKANAGSQRDLDVRTMRLASSRATLREDEARLQTALKEVDVARANVAVIQTRIDDATLYSQSLGRVLYRLAEPGEVLAPGGKALTLVNLEDVYMEIFLASRQAAATKIGADARLTVDALPGRSAQGYVSFVSPEAQFTPKEVETRSERDKLMFRVKIQVPQEFVEQFVNSIKTGIRGVGYVQLDANAQWPQQLEANLIRAPREVTKQASAPSETTRQ